ncbi:MAG: hypothetical protein IKG58_01375 [Bacilli bacterium]|nr:hypothetical protein [Bacilli bacterium]MBR3049195.1 hypothetical protein [Bacilli bacterium]
MKYEKEITVELDTSFEELEKILINNSFKEKERYTVNDIYLINRNDKKEKDYLKLLSKCVLIRHIIEKDKDTKKITYKYKEYNDKKEIIKQGKIDCNIDDINTGIELFKKLNFEELININDNMIVYSNNEDELVVQYVNNKHIYIEIEDKCHYINKEYKTIEELKEVITKYNIPIKNNDYFVKKAEIELKENINKEFN